MGDMATDDDPFREACCGRGVLCGEFQGDEIPMILCNADVRAVAKDPAAYSFDAPFRVPIPPEEDVRSVRRLPIETAPLSTPPTARSSRCSPAARTTRRWSLR